MTSQLPTFAKVDITLTSQMAHLHASNDSLVSGSPGFKDFSEMGKMSQSLQKRLRVKKHQFPLEKIWV